MCGLMAVICFEHLRRAIVQGSYRSLSPMSLDGRCVTLVILTFPLFLFGCPISQPTQR